MKIITIKKWLIHVINRIEEIFVLINTFLIIMKVF